MTIYIGWTKWKVYRFILCSIVYIVVSQNTLFTVIPFHNLSDCDFYTPPTTGHEWETEAGGDENNQPGHNEELVPKWRTTPVAWSRVFKHSSFKTTDFKPLKIKEQSCMRALSRSVWEERAFSFLPTLNNYINTLICVRIPIFAGILKQRFRS